MLSGFPSGTLGENFGIMSRMEIDVKSAVAEIESTTDLLERMLEYDLAWMHPWESNG